MLKKLSKTIVAAVRILCCFRKPVFTEFHCIDLVAGNRLLFLMSWKMSNAHILAINPGRHRYRKAEGAAVVALLPGTATVDVVITNLWRKTILAVPLKHITLDKESMEMMVKGLALPRIEINLGLPAPVGSVEVLLNVIPDFKPLHFHTAFNPQFHYPKFLQDEP